MDKIRKAVYRYGMGLQKGRATRQTREMKVSISGEENYAITLLCIQRKRNLVNIHDKEIWPAADGKSRYNKVAWVRTAILDPIVLCKTNAIERLATPGLPLGKNLDLIKVDQFLGWWR